MARKMYTVQKHDATFENGAQKRNSFSLTFSNSAYFSQNAEFTEFGVCLDRTTPTSLGRCWVRCRWIIIYQLLYRYIIKIIEYDVLYLLSLLTQSVHTLHRSVYLRHSTPTSDGGGAGRDSTAFIAATPADRSRLGKERSTDGEPEAGGASSSCA